MVNVTKIPVKGVFKGFHKHFKVKGGNLTESPQPVSKFYAKQINSRLNDSVNQAKHRQEHYEKFLERRAFNIKHNIAPDYVKLDKKGYRL